LLLLSEEARMAIRITPSKWGPLAACSEQGLANFDEKTWHFGVPASVQLLLAVVLVLFLGSLRLFLFESWIPLLFVSGGLVLLAGLAFPKLGKITLTLTATKKGQPVLVKTSWTYFISVRRTYHLVKHRSLHVDNEQARARRVNLGFVFLFLLTGGLLWLYLADQGKRTGAWVLYLDSIPLVRHRSLLLVNDIAAKLKVAAGLEIGRPC
jgi:hypothetical protein